MKTFVTYIVLLVCVLTWPNFTKANESRSCPIYFSDVAKSMGSPDKVPDYSDRAYYLDELELPEDDARPFPAIAVYDFSGVIPKSFKLGGHIFSIASSRVFEASTREKVGFIKVVHETYGAERDAVVIVIRKGLFFEQVFQAGQSSL